jgi:filamentous hemagglutinin
LQGGKDINLNAARDVNLLSAQNTQTVDGKNESHGSSVGVGVNFGQGKNGLTLNASVNKGKGSESGNMLTHTETTLNAGNNLNITSGRDTTLSGAQVGGEKVTMDVGRNLTLTSEQDRDNYDSKQQNASAGGSAGVGTFSGSVNLSRDKMHSTYDAVQEQTGVFAGKGGFDITVGEHTQLNGAVIGSTATADKNKLDTGTLGFNNIENKADYQVEHQSVGISSGGSIGGQFAGNMANGLLTGVNGSGSASSTTQSAVSEGTITIRDQANQKQDVADLSRDVENANPGLDKIFDKEKEQNRLKEAQLIGEIGSQAADIARTQGQIAGLKAQKDPAALQAAKEALAAKGNTNPSDTQIAEQAYNTAQAQWGTGSAIQQGIQAATAAVQGLAGGNIGQAISGAAAPYLAEQIHKLTDGNPAAQAMAHAVVGAVVAQAAGNSAAAGAAGAVSGELMAQLVMNQLYPGKTVDQLSETERQTISALGTLAAGLAGGLAGDSSADVVAGGQAGKNAVENNALSAPQIDDFAARAKGCDARGDCGQIVKEMEDLSLKQRNELIVTCASDAAACKEKYGDIPANSMLVHEAIDRALGEDIPWAMKNDLSVLLMQQMDESGIVNSTEFAQQLQTLYGLDSQKAEILAGAAMAAVTGGMGKGKGSAMPVPTPTKAGNGLVYQSNGKHTPGQVGYNRNAGTEPTNSIQLFGNSVENGKKRYALDEKGNVHQFTNTNDGSWHWSGSTGDASVPLKKSDIPNAVKKEFGLPGKWR